uniref:DUF4283 domain-containing protein n=1 Tax=Chenopodium quinoa TaxID=63459 RepID=A0A803NBH9_CHEQI
MARKKKGNQGSQKGGKDDATINVVDLRNSLLAGGQKTKSKGDRCDSGLKNRASVNVAEVSSIHPPQSELNKPVLQLSMDDIVDELDCCNLGVVAFTIAANPHIKTFEGFCYRIWGKLNVDKVIPLRRGIFLIRFLNSETRDKALTALNFLMDKKPYWGKSCLEKIVGLIGKPIRPDAATLSRDRVAYVRYLVEMDLKQEFPNKIDFLNEKGILFEQNLTWEWKPQWCSVCGGMGRANGTCQKKTEKMVWRPKLVKAIDEPKQQQKEDHELDSDPIFVPVENGKKLSPIRQPAPQNDPVLLQNSFDSLKEDTLKSQVVFGDGLGMEYDGREGAPTQEH